MPKSNTSGRFRNFYTLVYPDSAPENWKSILADLHIPCFISPIHDKDVNPDGTNKKAHYHVLLMFDGKKSFEQVKSYISTFNAVGVDSVTSLRAYARYLCHLDNPEKHIYSVDDVVSYCGSVYEDVIGLPYDVNKLLDEMEAFCDKYRVTSFSNLCRYARLNRPDWSRVLRRQCTVYMVHYIKSNTWSNGVNDNHIMDPDTGEFIL